MGTKPIAGRSSKETELVPPQSLEAEQSVLGSILKDDKAFDLVLTILKHEQVFYSQRHRRIFRAAMQLYMVSEPIDITTVSERLTQNGDLESVGGRSYLVELCEGVATTVNVVAHAEIVREKATLRQLSEAAREIDRDAFEATKPAREQLNTAEAKIFSIAETGAKSKLVSLSALTPIVADKLLKIDPSNQHDIFETRIADLNRVIRGLYRGESTFIAGEPSSGKTSFALDTCLFNLNWGRKIYFVSLDQRKMLLLLPDLAHWTPKNRLYSGQMSLEEKDQIGRYGAELARHDNFLIDDDPNMTVLDIRSEARRIKRQFGLDIVVIDYVQKIPPHGRLDNRHQEITEISRILTATAKDLDVAMVILSQLNRNRFQQKIDWESNNWNFPNMGMLRESGSLEQDASQILFPVVPIELLKVNYGEQSSYYQDALRAYPVKNGGKDLTTLAYMIVGKQKDGEKAVVECRRDAVRMRFYSEAR
ncbi:MAG: AAA family ATPase [bacterium]|nr:AAA family ATPase [bacterium]